MDLSKTNRGELFDTLNAVVNEVLNDNNKGGSAMQSALSIITKVKGSEPKIDRARHAADLSAIKAATTELAEEAQDKEDKATKKSGKKQEKGEQ